MGGESLRYTHPYIDEAKKMSKSGLVLRTLRVRGRGSNKQSKSYEKRV